MIKEILPVGRRVGAAYSAVLCLVLLGGGAAIPHHALAQGVPLVRPLNDVADGAVIPKTYPRPASAWKTSEKAFYENLLSKGKFDILVVPFQVEYLAVSRATRSFMTAQLSRALAADGKAKLPDPYLVARALGEGDRRLNPEDVYRLANKLQVKRVIWTYVGHGMPLAPMEPVPSDYVLHFTFEVQERTQKGALYTKTPREQKTFERIRYTDEVPAIEVFQQRLPEFLKALGMASGQAPKPGSGTVGSPSVPATPFAMTQGPANRVRDAHFLQLLAALTPLFADRARERFTEKSLLAVLDIPTDDPDYRYLKAQGLMQLGMRAAAVHALGTPASPAEMHLRAVLDGNLSAARASANRVNGGVKSLVAALDTNRIEGTYGTTTTAKSKALIEGLSSLTDAWSPLVTRAATDWDAWSQHSNVELKQQLDRDFPIPGSKLEDLMRGAVSLGNFANVESIADLSVLNHVRNLLESAGDKWCCETLQPRVTALDYLDLMEAVSTDNLIKRAKYLTETQGSPDAALSFIGRIETVYRDHPQLTLARARAEYGMAARAQGVAKTGLLRSAYRNALNAAFWEQGQTRTAAETFELLAELGPGEYGQNGNLYASDRPYRAFYPTWQAGSRELQLRNATAALRNATRESQPVRALYGLFAGQNQLAKFEDVIKSLGGRFQGEPEIALLKAKASLARGDTGAAEKHYRESIASRPGHWESHNELGMLLLENGRMSDASRIFRSFGGFKDVASEHPVKLSNNAYDAGSLFFWVGYLEQAEHFYSIAANLDTGSEASITSAIRLALMKGDLNAAGRGSLLRAQRYNSPFAYRDYIGILHAMGHSKAGWDAFNTLARQLDTPQIWETALVGHRRAGATESEIAAWASQDWLRAAGKISGFASLYLVRAAMVDRSPSADVAKVLAQMERPVWQVQAEVLHTVRPSLDGQVQRILGPKLGSGASLLLPGLFQRLPKTRITSDLVYFVEGYRAIRHKDFKKATANFREAADLYDVSHVNLAYLLPYYAFAAAKAKDTAALKALLDQFPMQDRRFDYFLARAIVDGMAGKTAQALRSLNLAKHRRPFTEYRPINTEYQFAEICEWLYEATKADGYRQLALEWARKNQVTQPWFAWPYAVEATLATSGPDRSRAIAMVHYLDKDSERLKRLPAAEVQAAVSSFSARNPFTQIGERRDGPI